MAYGAPGLVLPFRTYYALSEHNSALIRNRQQTPWDCEPESIMENSSAVGAVNTMHHASIDAIGQWDEGFEGSWYDDRAMKIAFDMCCGPTRFVPGVGRHLYHLPGWRGEHLTDLDRQVTKRNRERLRLYRSAATPKRIHELTAGARS